MRIVFGLVLLSGLGLAGFAAMKTSEYISATNAREQAALQQIVPTVGVFVAKDGLAFGHVLTPDDVIQIHWPRNAVPEAAFLDPAALFPPDAGGQKRTVIRQMEKFEPILASKITEPGADAGLNTRLARGMRAFPIRVDANSGVAGLVQIGDRIDLYWTGNAAGLTQEIQGEFTKLIESGLAIIAIGSNTSGGTNSSANTITVEATPQQVARLAQAQASGRLSMSMMGIAEDGESEVSDVDRRELLGIERQEQELVEAAKVCTIRTRRGGDVVEIPIPCTN